MTLTLKKDIQKHVVASGDYALAAPGGPLFTCIGSGRKNKIIYNVLPGQIVAYTISNGVTTIVDDTTLSSADIYELYIGVGVDLTGNGITDDVRHLGIEQVSGCAPKEVSTSSPRCGGPQVVDFYFDCTQCDETYSVIVRIDDNRTRSFSPWNKSFSEFVGSIVTQCHSCNDCPVEHNCKEVACKLADALNNELDLKVGNGSYPDWKGQGLPRPYYATRLHETSLIYCLTPQTEEGGCEDCTYVDAISGANINGTYYEFVGTTNPKDGSQTLLGQVENVALQLQDAFVDEYDQGQSGVDPHAGSAYATGSYQQCCSVQLHVNTCDATFQLLDSEGAVITPQTSNNPFVTYGTSVNTANCIDCGEGGVKATGTLTLTVNPLDTETVSIGGQVYTFQTTLTDAPNNVLIGATTADSILNLVNAINGGPGAGTDYGTGTTPNASAGAQEGAGLTMDVIADDPGTAGNAITTTTTVTGGSFGNATLTGGTDGTLGTQEYVCGIRIIAEQIKGDCDCYISQPLAFYGRKLNVLPFGDGWKGKSWKVTEVQAMELPAGFGAWIQWLEYQDLPEGRGRRYDRSNINKGWANLPGNKARVKNAVTAQCDKNYCSYYMKSVVDKSILDGTFGVITIHSNMHIPSTDSVTIGSWETFFDALIALNPACKKLTTTSCDTAIGGC